MPKREWGEESNGKLLHISIPSKTSAWVPEFAVEDLPLRRTAALVPVFAVKDLYYDDDDIRHEYFIILIPFIYTS